MTRLWVLLAVTAWGCGGFDNRRFDQGDGTLVGVAPPGAEIFVLHRADLATVAGPDGFFHVEGVPAGGQALLVTAEKSALLHEVRVVADRTADAGLLTLGPVATLMGAARPGALVWVPGTALAVRSDEQGRWTLEGLPAQGCVPVTVEGADAMAGCTHDGEEVDLTVAGPERPCLVGLDCPVGGSCDAGACRLSSESDPDPEPDLRSCEGAADLGGACGPPGLCGYESFLDCDPDGRVVCSGSDGVASECDGFGDVLVVEALSLHGGPGFDLDDRDGDGDLRTGGDNVVGDVDALRPLLDEALRRSLELGEGSTARYLIEVRPGALRFYVGVEVEPGVYEPRWSFLADDDVPLGRLPLMEGAEGLLAGPGAMNLAVDVAGFRLPFPLTRAYLDVHTSEGAAEIGGAVNVANLLESIQDPHLRALLDSALSPGDVDTDGDGRLDALSLGIDLRVGRGALRPRGSAGP